MINQIFDKTFKRILTLSKKSVISLINGLFQTNHPLDSDLDYHTIEHVDDELNKTLADMILTINHIHSYHLEAQIYKDEEIIFRVFDYGYHHALTNSRNSTAIFFPEPVVIYLDKIEYLPEEYTLDIHFGNQGTFQYHVPTCNFCAMSPEEIKEKNMIILLPFYILKLRKLIQKSRSVENLALLKSLIFDDIIHTIDEYVTNDFLSINDARVLKSLLLKLYRYVYADYEETKNGGINDMVEDALVLDIDIIEHEHQMKMKKLRDELENIISKKDAALSEKDAALSEKDAALSEKDRIILAYRLLTKNVPIESIEKQTGLNQEEIKALEQ